jgi:hypothetical protein
MAALHSAASESLFEHAALVEGLASATAESQGLDALLDEWLAQANAARRKTLPGSGAVVMDKVIEQLGEARSRTAETMRSAGLYRSIGECLAAFIAAANDEDRDAVARMVSGFATERVAMAPSIRDALATEPNVRDVRLVSLGQADEKDGDAIVSYRISLLDAQGRRRTVHKSARLVKTSQGWSITEI